MLFIDINFEKGFCYKKIENICCEETIKNKVKTRRNYENIMCSSNVGIINNEYRLS
jgi:hypothetical protein